jgi:hypothetical protein
VVRGATGVDIRLGVENADGGGAIVEMSVLAPPFIATPFHADPLTVLKLGDFDGSDAKSLLVGRTIRPLKAVVFTALHGLLSCGNCGSRLAAEPSSDRANASLCRGRRGVGAELDLAAVHEIDRRIEDDLLARPHSGVRFNPRAEVARYCKSAYLSLAVVDHRDL